MNKKSDSSKPRTAIWGARKLARDFLDSRVLNKDYDIACIVDNDPDKWGILWCSYPVLSPSQLCEERIDCIIICSNYYDEIKRQIIDELDIDVDIDAIISIKTVEDKLARKLCEKYKDTDDQEIKRVIDYYQKNGFELFGYYHPKRNNRYDVYRDDDNWPYVIFENKKMYYPRNRVFANDSRGEYVENILLEQQPGSPHLYVKEDKVIPANGVIVDAGVCEGNFALRYVENAKKLYLIEADEEWCEALKKTFAPFVDKVVLCNKYLGGIDSDRTITLDSLVNDRIDFLKMDIEGAETEALRGAERVLRASDAYCAICSYHRCNDEIKIKRILNEYGYSTSVSEGYMFFIYDDNISDTMDFRRGIVYGKKHH